MLTSQHKNQNQKCSHEPSQISSFSIHCNQEQISGACNVTVAQHIVNQQQQQQWGSTGTGGGAASTPSTTYNPSDAIFRPAITNKGLLFKINNNDHQVDSIVEFKKRRGTNSQSSSMFRLEMCCACCTGRTYWFSKKQLQSNACDALIELADQVEAMENNGIDISSQMTLGVDGGQDDSFCNDDIFDESDFNMMDEQITSMEQKGDTDNLGITTANNQLRLSLNNQQLPQQQQKYDERSYMEAEDELIIDHTQPEQTMLDITAQQCSAVTGFKNEACFDFSDEDEQEFTMNTNQTPCNSSCIQVFKHVSSTIDQKPLRKISGKKQPNQFKQQQRRSFHYQPNQQTNQQLNLSNGNLQQIHGQQQQQQKPSNQLKQSKKRKFCAMNGTSNPASVGQNNQKRAKLTEFNSHLHQH